MSTLNNNLPELPTGPVDWVAVFNLLVAALEKMPGTLYLENNESFALTQGMGFYVDSNGKAKKALSSTEQLGLWDSVSTAAGTNGYGRIAGVMTKSGWGLTPGSYYYLDSSGDLTLTPTNNHIGFAKSATEMIINPFKK